jgi:hypothetical protein
MKFLYHYRYISALIGLFIIVFGIVKKHPFSILLGVCFVLLIIIITIREKITTKKWELIVKPLIDEIPERENCDLYSDNKMYRIGDMVSTYSRFLDSGEKYHLKTFPNSIASEYMKKTKKFKKYNILADIVRERSNNTDDLPNDKDLIVHLRVGDVVEDNSNNLSQILTNYSYNFLHNYTCPIRNIQDKINKSKENFDKIILVAGSHKDILSPRSCKYIDVVKKYFENNGYIVELRLGKNPDDDFIFMSNAKYFIPSCSGNYTLLVKKIVKILGGKVL